MLRMADGLVSDFNSLLADSRLSAEAVLKLAELEYGSWNTASALEIQKAITDLIEISDTEFAVDMLEKLVTLTKAEQKAQKHQLLANISSVTNLLVARHTDKEEIPIEEATITAFERILQRARSGRLQLGIKSVDRFTNYIMRGEVVVIGARTGVGKSMLAIQPAIENALFGHQVLLCMNEMDNESMSARIVSHLSGINSDTVMDEDSQTSYQKELITSAMEDLCSLPILMKENVTNVEQIEMALSKNKMMGLPVDLVILDHFNRLEDNSPRYRQRVDFLAQQSHLISDLAKKYNCVFIVMAQVNREGAVADRLELIHLKGAGAIEEDASKVYLMYGDKNDQSNRILYLAKNRFGPYDQTFVLKMYGDIMRFQEVQNFRGRGD